MTNDNSDRRVRGTLNPDIFPSPYGGGSFIPFKDIPTNVSDYISNAINVSQIFDNPLWDPWIGKGIDSGTLKDIWQSTPKAQREATEVARERQRQNVPSSRFVDQERVFSPSIDPNLRSTIDPGLRSNVDANKSSSTTGSTNGAVVTNEPSSTTDPINGMDIAALLAQPLDETDLTAIASRIARYDAIIAGFGDDINNPLVYALAAEAERLKVKGRNLDTTTAEEKAAQALLESREYQEGLTAQERAYNERISRESQRLQDERFAETREANRLDSLMGILLPIMLSQRFDVPRKEKQFASRLALDQQRIDLDDRIARLSEAREAGREARTISEEEREQAEALRGRGQTAGLIQSLFPDLPIGDEILEGGISPDLLQSIIAIARNQASAKAAQQQRVARPTISYI